MRGYDLVWPSGGGREEEPCPEEAEEDWRLLGAKL